jgi:NitT/TauT family transport system substrate-binding protein
MNTKSAKHWVAGLVAAALTVGLASGTAVSAAPQKPSKLATAKTLRIGYLTNVTHATALVGIQRGLIRSVVGSSGTSVQFTTFSAGPAEVEALKGGSIDAAFIGVSPAVSGFVSTNGSLLRIVSGATTGGAQFITKPSITTVGQLRGKTFATPQLGGTQDIALRSYLARKGYKTNVYGVGGDVTVSPADNATTLASFKSGNIDGAWVPEPWASRLVLEGNGRVFLDEKSLWKSGNFITTQLVVAKNYLNQYPGTIRALIGSEFATNKWIKANKQAAKDAVQAQLLTDTGKNLSDAVINRAWENITPTLDPLSASLLVSVNHAVDAGLLPNIGARGVQGIYDLRLLNQLMKSKGLKTYRTTGLGLK